MQHIVSTGQPGNFTHTFMQHSLFHNQIIVLAQKFLAFSSCILLIVLHLSDLGQHSLETAHLMRQRASQYECTILSNDGRALWIDSIGTRSALVVKSFKHGQTAYSNLCDRPLHYQKLSMICKWLSTMHHQVRFSTFTVIKFSLPEALLGDALNISGL